MQRLIGTVLRSALLGAAVGFPILGVGGRGLMRIIAHMEGRVPAFSFGGTMTVVFAGTMAGLAGGAVHGMMRRYIQGVAIRNILFVLISIAFTWRAVNELLPLPRLMFVALTLLYALVLEIVTAKERHRVSTLAQNNPISLQ